MKGITVDSESRVVATHYAIVYSPRRSRGRFAETCVEIVASEYDALEQADPEKKYYAAKVIGPSKSSEGQRIFYLDDWL
ncbi:MAG: hypothetical protein OEY43_09620 [Gammaproteobacteria bacterium]|nr:hypothetical protein [Gammaproteobacteria bacterium]